MTTEEIIAWIKSALNNASNRWSAMDLEAYEEILKFYEKRLSEEQVINLD